MPQALRLSLRANASTTSAAISSGRVPLPEKLQRSNPNVNSAKPQVVHLDPLEQVAVLARPGAEYGIAYADGPTLVVFFNT